MLVFACLAVAVSLGIDLLALAGIGRRTPVGDERAYLISAHFEDPHVPWQFLRPPLFIWIVARFIGREACELHLRLLMVSLSAVTAGVTAAAAWQLGGPLLAVLSSALLIFHPENILISCHIWPDIVLALVIALLNLLIVAPLAGAPLLVLAVGMVCAVGAHTRIDFVIVPPIVGASLVSSNVTLGPYGWLSLLAPTVAGLVLYSLRNYRRYGIPLPDTTWAFNLMASETEMLQGAAEPREIEPIVSTTFSRWQELEEPERHRRVLGFARQVVANPLRFLLIAGQRLLTMMGPDSFVRQKLLRNPGAYPELGERGRTLLEAPLAVASPLLFTFVVVTMLLRGSPPPSYSWPAFGVLLAPVLFFARTRYRVAVFPTFALLAAQGIVDLPALLNAPTPTQVALLLLSPLALWVLVRFVPRVEVST